MSQIAEINQNLGKFNTQAQLFTNSMKVVRTCHVYNSDKSVNEENFKIKPTRIPSHEIPLCNGRTTSEV